MFNSIVEVLEDLKNGRMVIVVDDEGRENEGDLVMPASSVKAHDINFMATYGRGLICVPMIEERLKALDLEPMLPNARLVKWSTSKWGFSKTCSKPKP